MVSLRPLLLGLYTFIRSCVCYWVAAQSITGSFSVRHDCWFFLANPQPGEIYHPRSGDIIGVCALCNKPYSADICRVSWILWFCWCGLNGAFNACGVFDARKIKRFETLSWKMSNKIATALIKIHVDVISLMFTSQDRKSLFELHFETKLLKYFPL